MNDMTVNKTCANCGEQFSHGRADKKFCTDACRIDNGNLVKMKSRIEIPAFIKNIQKIQVQNYKILKQLNITGTTKVPKKKMEVMGFNFRYHTSSHTTKKGDTYHFCFDQGYLSIKEGLMLLVVQEDQITT